MKVTDNLNLNLPDFSNNANIEDLNKNSIIIDNEVNKLKVKLSNLEGTSATKEEIERIKKSISDLEEAQLIINNKINNLNTNKVDKISGKGLSTNDFTNAHKRKVDVELPESISKAGKVDMVNNIKPDESKNVNITGSDIPYNSDSDETILNKIDILNSEIDTVKQSGVKSNKRLSDKLNSLEIPASDDDSISINIGKFESIENQGKLDKTIALDDYQDLIGKQTVLSVPKGYYTGGKIEVERVFDDMTGSPGGKYVQVGDKEEGYFGVVSASQLINGNALASKVGVTAGTSQHSDTPWHKFSWRGKILFIAQKTIRHSISWNHLNEKGVIYGDKIIEIDGIKYKVRLIKGALTDPSDYNASDHGAKGSEWNRLVVPLSVRRKDNSWGYPAYMESDLQDWGTYISDSELTVKDGSGRGAWCQEVGGDKSDYRVYRGYGEVSFSHRTISSSTHSGDGWRPVLEVVE